jgi:hypothetical protein
MPQGLGHVVDRRYRSAGEVGQCPGPAEHKELADVAYSAPAPVSGPRRGLDPQLSPEGQETHDQR